MTAPRRYTALPCPALEEKLDAALEDLAREIDALQQPKLVAVVLGGGYGRGEGGILRTPTGDRLYNDLDFFVFAQNATRDERVQIDQALASLAPKWSEKLQVSVDFGPTKNLADLSKVARTLMYQELLRGWKPVWGKIDLSSHLPALSADELPVTEAIRLLLNRGMGLLLAGEHLAANSDEQDFIARNMHKALLGCGDALLLANGRYAWSAAEHLAAIQNLALQQNLPRDFDKGYESAFRYKQEPTPQLPDDPWEFWHRCRHLWLWTVQTVAGQADSDANLVRIGLHRTAIAERSLRNFLRWTFRARRLRPPRIAFDAPVVTLLGMLYTELLPEATAYPVPTNLLRLWQFFN